MSDIQNKVFGLLAEKFDISANDIKLTDHFIDDLHGDSLDSVEIVQDTEEAFNIENTDEEQEKIATVGDLVTIVESKK